MNLLLAVCALSSGATLHPAYDLTAAALRSEAKRSFQDPRRVRGLGQSQEIELPIFPTDSAKVTLRITYYRPREWASVVGARVGSAGGRTERDLEAVLGRTLRRIDHKAVVFDLQAKLPLPEEDNWSLPSLRYELLNEDGFSVDGSAPTLALPSPRDLLGTEYHCELAFPFPYEPSNPPFLTSRMQKITIRVTVDDRIVNLVFQI